MLEDKNFERKAQEKDDIWAKNQRRWGCKLRHPEQD